MQLFRLFLLVIAVLFSACAQVPKESVDLSTTVGRDITTIHKSHRELAKLMFVRMRQDVNRFVDNVYTPYQIRHAMENDYKNAKSSEEQDRKASILLAINSAFKPDASEKLQGKVLGAMGYMFSAIRDDIESKRQELLAPLNEQEATILASIDRNYSQIIYANSIVTGYLASIVKVHDAQNEVLNAMGVDANLNEVVGKKLAAASGKITNLVQKAESAQATTDSITATIKDLKSAVSSH